MLRRFLEYNTIVGLSCYCFVFKIHVERNNAVEFIDCESKFNKMSIMFLYMVE